ncbi:MULTISPECIES: hypothetical protein [unclassified Psychrobacillus]|uniref:hypothetical protein n=1 Tax=unclassified Psychrobacillus TaxID=2636677 RepID=UPI0030F901DF
MDKPIKQEYENMILSGMQNQNNSHLKELEEKVKRYEKALHFYADGTKYLYAKKEHPNTRLAEDGGEIARKALAD